VERVSGRQQGMTRVGYAAEAAKLERDAVLDVARTLERYARALRKGGHVVEFSHSCEPNTRTYRHAWGAGQITTRLPGARRHIEVACKTLGRIRLDVEEYK
jgi:hypothetical protein